MKKFIIFLLVLVPIFSESSSNKFGGGLYYKLSKYNGGENKLVPIFNLQYYNLTIVGTELIYNISNSTNYTISPFLKFDYTEGFKSGELSGANALLNERKNPLLIGLKTSKNLNNLNLELSYFRDLTSDSNNLRIKGTYTLKLLDYLYFIPSISGIYSDSNYINYYYGISRDEAILTNSEYKELNSSIRGELELGGVLFFSPTVGSYFAYNVEILNGNNFNDALISHLANKSFILNIFYKF